MRVAPHELLHHALDLDPLSDLVGRGERMMPERATSDGEENDSRKND
jgi:hypothetical protein